MKSVIEALDVTSAMKEMAETLDKLASEAEQSAPHLLPALRRHVTAVGKLPEAWERYQRALDPEAWDKAKELAAQSSASSMH